MALWVIAGLTLLAWIIGSAARRSWVGAATGAAALAGLAVGFSRLRVYLAAEVDRDDDVERMLALAGVVVLVGLGCVGAGILCRWKGKRGLGWCGIGAVALPVVSETALLAVSEADGSDWDTGEAMGFAVLWIFANIVVLAISVALGLVAVAGAVRLAKPDSSWAARWYGPQRLAEARRRFRWSEEASIRLRPSAGPGGHAARRDDSDSERRPEPAGAGSGRSGDLRL